MKILILPGQGTDTGCYLRSCYIASGLRKSGNDVDCLVPFRTFPLFMDFPFTLLLYIFKTIFRKYDIAIAMKPYPNACIPALIQKFKGAKFIADVDDIDYGYRGGVISKIVKMMQNPFPKYADLVTYHNEHLLVHIEQEFGVSREKTFNIGQGVDTEIYSQEIPNGEKKDLIKKHDLKDKQIIVYTAHLNIAACIDEILEAYSMVKKDINNSVLVIAGGGPMLRHYANKAEKMHISNIIFTGYVDNKEIVKYIAVSDVCVVYYKNEISNVHRTSMKLREYLCQGKPVVCNDVGDLKKFEKYTYQSISDIGKFADKIKDVLLGKVDNRQEKGKKYVIENLSWDKLVYDFNQEIQRKFK